MRRGRAGAHPRGSLGLAGAFLSAPRLAHVFATPVGWRSPLPLETDLRDAGAQSVFLLGGFTFFDVWLPLSRATVRAAGFYMDTASCQLLVKCDSEHTCNS